MANVADAMNTTGSLNKINYFGFLGNFNIWKKKPLKLIRNFTDSNLIENYDPKVKEADKEEKMVRRGSFAFTIFLKIRLRVTK